MRLGRRYLLGALCLWVGANALTLVLGASQGKRLSIDAVYGHGIQVITSGNLTSGPTFDALVLLSIPCQRTLDCAHSPFLLWLWPSRSTPG